jgi:hypothetical protein
MLRRWFIPWLFALALVCGQMAALAHAASHVKQAHGLPDHACKLCLAHANLGGGAPATALAIDVPDAVYHWAAPVADFVTDNRPPLARARAPPTVV